MAQLWISKLIDCFKGRNLVYGVTVNHYIRPDSHCSRTERSRWNPKRCHTNGGRLDQTSGQNGDQARAGKKGQGINKKGQIFTKLWCPVIQVMSNSIHTEVSFIYRSGAHFCQHLKLHLSVMVAEEGKFSSQLSAVGLLSCGWGNYWAKIPTSEMELWNHCCPEEQVKHGA